MKNPQKHILVLSQVYPYPLHDGGRFDVYYRLKALHDLGYAVTLVAFYNPALAHPELEPLQRLCTKVYTLPYLRRKLSKIFHWKPYSIGSRENNSDLEKIVGGLVQEKIPFNAILAESHHVLTVAWKLKGELNIPKLYLRSHNNEPRFMLSLAQTSPMFSVKQLFFLLEAAKYKLYEKVLMKRFCEGDEILHISHDEWKQGQRKHPNLTHKFLPAGIDLSTQQPYKPSNKKNVLFAGALFSPNNLQGLKWYVEKIHPKISSKIPDYRLIVAGNTRGADLKEIASILDRDPNIKFYDTPKEMSPIYSEAQVFINPMQYGAGVKLKTIDAILKGLPVVTTSIGNEGTGLVHDKHILVADKPVDYEQAVCKLLTNPSKREQIISNAQSFLVEDYDQARSLQRIFK